MAPCLLGQSCATKREGRDSSSRQRRDAAAFRRDEASLFILVRLLYARAPVRVLLVETEARALAFARVALEGFVDALVAVEDALVLTVAASTAGETDLVVIARDSWNEKDTELCRSLQKERLAVPVLAVSGPCDARQRAAALRAGADDFLGMPFEPEELVARVLALVRRALSRSRYARAGAFAVDFTYHQVLVGGRRVALTLREFDLLAVLVDRSGEVVTRQELAGRPTQGPTKTESNSVDVHMSRIREKLGTYAAQIETVRGIGYRLRPPGGDTR